jgi:threonylcarbamoyladenosine tRNA methylthiotransferase MtaB
MGEAPRAVGQAECLSFGCRLNLAEGEAMRGLAARAGCADALIVNTCAVTAEAEAQARQAIRRAARTHPDRPILVTGCAAQIAPARWAALPGVARVIGNGAKLDPASWNAGVGPITRDTPAMPAAGGATRAFIAVQQGCDHACTFCIIPAGRGPSRSVPVAEVIAAIGLQLAQGKREAVLTGVDLASWRQGELRLGDLVRAVLRAWPDLPRLRLSTLDPAAMDPALWRAIAEEPRLMPHLHLSAQHGADLILKRMRRRHSRADVVALAARARALRPGIVIGADLIAGFPTETEAHHAQTLALIEEAELALLHVFPFSARAGTPAARMPPLPVGLRRERAAALRAAGEAMRERHLAARIGQADHVLMEAGNRGHGESFLPVRLASGALPAGALARLRITGSRDGALLAEPG